MIVSILDLHNDIFIKTKIIYINTQISYVKFIPAI